MAFNETLASATRVPVIAAKVRTSDAFRNRVERAFAKREGLPVPPDTYSPGFTATERYVLLHVCLKANKRGRLFPAHKTLADEMGLSRATVVRAMAVLEAQGWIERIRRRRKDGTRSTDLLTVSPPSVVRAPERMLPLMAVVSSTGAIKVAQCNTDKVAQCVPAPPYQGCTVQQQIPTTQESNLRAVAEPVASPPVESEAERQEVGRMMARLAEELTARRRVA